MPAEAAIFETSHEVTPRGHLPSEYSREMNPMLSFNGTRADRMGIAPGTRSEWSASLPGERVAIAELDRVSPGILGSAAYQKLGTVSSRVLFAL